MIDICTYIGLLFTLLLHSAVPSKARLKCCNEQWSQKLVQRISVTIHKRVIKHKLYNCHNSVMEPTDGEVKKCRRVGTRTTMSHNVLPLAEPVMSLSLRPITARSFSFQIDSSPSDYGLQFLRPFSVSLKSILMVLDGWALWLLTDALSFYLLNRSPVLSAFLLLLN